MIASALPMQHRKRIRASVPAVLTLGIQGMSSLTSLFITWYLIRKIGVAGFGFYAIYLMLAVNITTVSNSYLVQPLNSIASKLTPRRQEEFIMAANLGQVAISLGMIAIGALTVLVARFFGATTGDVVAVTFFTIAMNIDDYRRRIEFFRRRPMDVLLHDVLRYVLTVAVIVLIPRIYSVPTAVEYTIGLAIPYVIAMTPFAIRDQIVYAVPFDRRLAMAHLRRMNRSGKWLAGGAALRFLNARAVILVSFYFIGAYEAGLIRLGQTIVGLTNPAIQAMEHTIPTMIGRRIREAGKEQAIRELHRIGLWTLVAFSALYLLTFAASPLVVRVMGVKGDMRAVWLIGGFCITYILTVATTLLIFELRVHEKTRIVSSSLIYTTIVALVIAYPCIKYFGVYGVIVSAIVTQVLSIYLLIRNGTPK